MVMVVNAITDWPCLTMVDHGQLVMVSSWSMIVNPVSDHGQPWSFRGLSTLKWPSFDHGHYMVDDGHGTTDWPWSTMVDHGQYIEFDYHWPSYDHDYWPWSTMVNHGHLEAYRPWNDHHLTMVITWLMMVMVLLTDHGQPWLTMVNISDLTTIDHHMTMTIDHGHDHRSILQTWSTMVQPW